MTVKPKKALGQHFLTDHDTARRIALTIDIPPYRSLPALEIGPGTGMLTRYLMEQPRPLKAVEIDPESVAYLHTHYPSLDVMHADFLNTPPTQFYPGEFALIGNYPYNISSQIFFRVLEYKDTIPLCAGMLQREVAQRICAPPGGKDRGILSVLLQVWYDCEYLFTVPETVFNPPPKVKSGVIRLVRNSVTDPGCDPRLLRTVVKTTFGQRRKTIRNSLSPLLPKGTLPPDNPLLLRRPETLSVREFTDLTNLVQQLTKS